jgi:hypothetical protein
VFLAYDSGLDDVSLCPSRLTRAVGSCFGKKATQGQWDGHSNRARMVFASSPVRLIGSTLNLAEVQSEHVS